MLHLVDSIYPNRTECDKLSAEEVRYMEEKTIRGELTYNQKQYPFVIEKRILTIVQSAFHYCNDFPAEGHLGTLMGITDGNQYIFLLDCRILNRGFSSLSGKIQMGLHGYILQETAVDRFDSIEFYSPALRAFYSPRKAWQPELTAEKHMQGITLTPYEDVAIEIPMTVGAENLQCCLGFSRYFRLRFEEQYALSINTGLILDLPGGRSSRDLGKYFLYVLDFLAFINFERNIPFDDIVLWRQNADGESRKSGNAVIFQAENMRYKPDVLHSITYDDLGKDLFAALFKEIAEQRLQGKYNPYYLPENRSEVNIVEKSRWLMAAFSFEGEYNKRYKSVKAEQDETFYEVKEMLLHVIDEAVQQSGVSINNPRNKYLKNFRQLINTTDTTIQEKFQFCESHFQDEIKQIKEKHCLYSSVSVNTNFAENYSKTRNSAAHGSIESITSEDVVTFQLLRSFIYLLIMERVSIPSEKRKEIISKLF